ncbi:hypothetical protein HDF12_001296 [Edaphobacter lichenicola]|uniref:Uncharacterized protein n=1 Tax=Tunturiibacter lichenicola TaxID=2051959 RepID=A0A7Y9NK97_9BACT|nr:hypothetical protein [Edaphobacter lichenicola]
MMRPIFADLRRCPSIRSGMGCRFCGFGVILDLGREAGWEDMPLIHAGLYISLSPSQSGRPWVAAGRVWGTPWGYLSVSGLDTVR